MYVLSLGVDLTMNDRPDVSWLARGKGCRASGVTNNFDHACCTTSHAMDLAIFRHPTEHRDLPTLVHRGPRWTRSRWPFQWRASTWAGSWGRATRPLRTPSESSAGRIHATGTRGDEVTGRRYCRPSEWVTLGVTRGRSLIYYNDLGEIALCRSS